ncbi:MAG: ArnT family glycosyltransferase [Candidatus Micrarchaeales archaeon]
MLIGFIFTAVLAIALASLVISVLVTRKDLARSIAKHIDGRTILVLIGVLLFFLIFSLLFVSPAEQLYFDENIYQGIAMNILAHGNALWCQYGTGYLQTCFSNAVYHDLIGYPFLLSIAFAIFGIGIQTAYAMQLFIGALSIIFFFLLSSMLFDKKSAAVASTIIFSLIPQLFIWSRTQAIPDLALMAFATLTFFLFVLFVRETKLSRFILFMSSLTLTVYMRIEGILLIPIFLILFFVYSDDGIVNTAKHRLKIAIEAINTNTKLLLALLFFIVLIIPDVYYLSLQGANPSYGQDGVGQQVFSIANFQSNFPSNVLFFLGNYNAVYQFPLVFPVETTALAVVGMIMILISGRKNKFGLLLLPLIWLGAYHLFYDFFYAGAATFGVDDRFMLQIVPGLALLGGFAVSELGERIGKLRKSVKLNYLVYGVIMIGAVIYPFITLIPNITLKPSDMPQQTVIYDALTFFYNNYNKVPTNCLVYTFTPDLWFEFNKSAAQITYLSSSDGQFLNNTKSYSCSVVDFGYWCNVPPYRGTTCSDILKNYNLAPLAIQNNTGKGESFAFYQIVNKT